MKCGMYAVVEDYSINTTINQLETGTCSVNLHNGLKSIKKYIPNSNRDSLGLFNSKVKIGEDGSSPPSTSKQTMNIFYTTIENSTLNIFGDVNFTVEYESYKGSTLICNSNCICIFEKMTDHSGNTLNINGGTIVFNNYTMINGQLYQGQNGVLNISQSTQSIPSLQVSTLKQIDSTTNIFIQYNSSSPLVRCPIISTNITYLNNTQFNIFIYDYFQIKNIPGQRIEILSSLEPIIGNYTLKLFRFNINGEKVNIDSSKVNFQFDMKDNSIYLILSNKTQEFANWKIGLIIGFDFQLPSYATYVSCSAANLAVNTTGIKHGIFTFEDKLNVTTGPSVYYPFTIELTNEATGSKTWARNFANLTCSKIINPVEGATPGKIFKTEKGIEATVFLKEPGRNLFTNYQCSMNCFSCVINPMGTVDSNMTISIFPKIKDCKLDKPTTTITFGPFGGTIFRTIDFPKITPEFYPPVILGPYPVNGTTLNVVQSSDSIDVTLDINLYTYVNINKFKSSVVLFDSSDQYAYKVGHTNLDDTSTYITKTRFDSNSYFRDLQIFLYSNISKNIMNNRYIFIQTKTSVSPLSYSLTIPVIPYPLLVVSGPAFYWGKKLQTVSINNHVVSTSPLFYGYFSGTVQFYHFSVSEAFSTFGQSKVTYSIDSSAGISLGFIPKENGESVIERPQIVLVGGEYKFYVRIKDNSTGGIRFYNNYQDISPYLILGDSKYGDYLIPFDPYTIEQFTFINSDEFTSSLQIRNPKFLNLYYFGGSHEYCNLLMTDFIEFRFSKNIIDLTHRNETIYLEFNFKNQIKSFVPIISVLFFKNYYVDFAGSWDPIKNLYSIPIELPKNLLPGYLSYRFKNLFMGYGSKIIDMTDLYSAFLEEALLTINTTESDVMPPFISSIIPIIEKSNPPVVGWRIIFLDQVNGFKEANITVNSDFDKVPYVFNLKLQDRISGNETNPEFEIRIPVITSQNYYEGNQRLIVCRKQVFTIISVTTQDQGAGYGSPNHIDPLIRFVGDDYFTSITFDCPDNSKFDKLEDSPPTIDQFNSTTESINSIGTPDERSFSVSFKVSDASGINPRINPTVFIHSQFMSPIGFPSSLTGFGANASTTHIYSCKINVPFNYGNRYILLSVGGIFDTLLNIKGASHYDLLTSTNTIKIINVTQTITPVIESHSKTYRSDGIVTVYGRNFPTVPENFKLFIGSNQANPNDYQLSDMLQYFILSYNSTVGANFTIYIIGTYGKSDVISNPFTIVTIDDLPPTPEPTPSATPSATPSQTPSQTPSPTPSIEPIIECKGTPLCSGHGECLPTGCNCTLPYYGPDCNSKLIEIEPEIDQEKPTSSGVVDNHNRFVTTSYLDNSKSPKYSNSANSLIGINIPYFKDQVLLDPNFQVLVDQSSGNRCKSGLTTAQIAGIAVASGVVFIVLCLVAVTKEQSNDIAMRFKKNLLTEIKDTLLKLCPQLKTIVITDYDAAFGKCPTSNLEEENLVKRNSYDSDRVNYSFQFLHRFNPRKIIIDTDVGDMKLNIRHIDNVLDCKSIRTVKFDNQVTPFRFTKRALRNDSGIVSLCIDVNDWTNWYDDIEDEDDLENYDEILFDDNPNVRKNSFLNLLTLNTQLKRLIIKDLPSNTFQQFFNCLINNRELSLKALCLGCNAMSKEDYQPLLQLPTINTLYTYPNTLSAALEHVKINPNIKILKCIGNSVVGTHFITEFLQNNTSSLEKLERQLGSNIVSLCSCNGNIEILKFVYEQINAGKLSRKKSNREIKEKDFATIIKWLSNKELAGAACKLLDYLHEKHQSMLKEILAKSSSVNIDDFNDGSYLLRSPEIRNWLFNHRQQYEMSQDLKNQFMEESIRCNDFSQVKLYLDNGLYAQDQLSYYLKMAYESGSDSDDPLLDLEIYQYLLQQQTKFSPTTITNSTENIIKNAAMKGKVKTFEYLFDLQYLNTDSRPPLREFLNGKLPIIKLLWENPKYEKYRETIKKTTDTHLPLCFHNDVPTVKYLYDNQIILFTDYSMKMAIHLGYLDIIKFLYSHNTKGYQITGFSTIFQNLIKTGKVEVVKFLLENIPEFKKLLNREQLMYYMKINYQDCHVDLIEYLMTHIQGIRIDISNTSDLSLNGYEKAIKCNLIKGVVPTIFEHGNFKLLNQLELNRMVPCFFMKHLLDASKNARIHMTAYLMANENKINKYDEFGEWSEILKSCFTGGNFELVKSIISKPFFKNLLLESPPQVSLLLGVPARWVSCKIEFIIKSMFELNAYELISCIIHNFVQIDCNKNEKGITIQELADYFIRFTVHPSTKIFKLLLETSEFDFSIFELGKLFSMFSKKGKRGDKPSFFRYLQKIGRLGDLLTNNSSLLSHCHITSSNETSNIILQTLPKETRTKISGVFNSIKKKASGIISGIGSACKTVYQDIVKPILTLPVRAFDKGSEMVGKVVDSGTKIAETVANSPGKAVQNVSGGLGSMFSSMGLLLPVDGETSEVSEKLASAMKLLFNDPSYSKNLFKIIEPREDGLDRIEDVRIEFSIEVGKKAKGGRVHSHSIIDTEHNTKISLDVDYVRSILPSLVNDLRLCFKFLLGLNRTESIFRKGENFERPNLEKGASYIGLEGCGVVESLGDGDTKGLKVGDRVSVIPFSQLKYPTNRYYGVFPSEILVKIPDQINDDIAASMLIPFLTGYFSMWEIGKIKINDFVLITAASSSTGLATIQIAKLAGAKVIVTSRTREKKQKLLEYGADYFICTKEEDIEKKIQSITKGKGVNIILDSIAGSFVNLLANCASQRGIIIEIGCLSEEVTPFPMKEIMEKYVNFKGYLLREHISDPLALKRGLDYLFNNINSFKSIIGTIFSGIEKIPEAHKLLDSKNLFGKIIVKF
eukprot:gene9699-11907_t